MNAEGVVLGAENCADKEKGAYTGEVSAAMVKSTGAQYVILGHSERRQYYGETAEILKEKVQLALANGLKVIFCCGETLEEREAEKQNEVVKAELEVLYSTFLLRSGRTSFWLTNQSGLSVLVRQLHLIRLRKCWLTSALSLLRSMVKRLQRTQQSSMVVAVTQATLQSCSASLTSTVA